MSSQTGKSESGTDLAELIDKITAQIRAGSSIDIADYQRQYPKYADQIEELVSKLGPLDEAEDSTRDRTLTKAPGDEGGGWRDSYKTAFDQLGEFIIVREIGRGGMGVVYEARERTLDRRVAIKVLPFASITDERKRARFKIEAQAAAGLHHPSIVPVYTVGSDKGVHYYAMQFIDGTSLAAVLAALRNRNGQNGSENSGAPPRWIVQSVSSAGSEPSLILSTETDITNRSTHESASQWRQHFRAMSELMIQAAEALDHAHQSGVIHRDIKPANLLLDKDGRLWVTDFGLARIEQDSELTMTGDLVGTLRYMSPEQTTSEKSSVDHRCDIYSLGATLYEMLTLRRAFDSRDREETLQQIKFRDPVSPSKVEPRTPADLDIIVMKALEKDPDARYQTAQALADDLKAFLNDEPISAKRSSFYARTLKWRRRHPAVVNLAIALLILVTIGSAISSILLRREQAETKRALLTAESNFLTSEAHRVSAEEAIANSEKLLYVRGLGSAARAWFAGDGAGAAALVKSDPAFRGRSGLQGFEWNVLNRSMTPRYKVLLRGDTEILSTAWSANGKYIATGNDAGQIQLWDSETDRLITTIDEHDGEVHGLAFHPDSQSLASVSQDGSLRTWQVPSGRPMAMVEGCHGGTEVFSVAFAHHGNQLATAGEDYTARTWQFDSLRPLKVLRGHTRAIRTIAYAPDGQTIATGGIDRTARLWNAESGRMLRTFRGHTGMVLCVTFSQSGNRVISSSNDHTIRFWDPESGSTVVIVQGHHDGVESIVALPDGKRLVAADRSGQIRIWRIVGKREIDRWEDAVIDGLRAVRISPDGRCWAGLTNEGRLLVRDLSSKRTIDVQSGIANQYPHSRCERIAFSDDGLLLYCADRILKRDSTNSFTWDNSLKLDVPSGTPGCFSPDGEVLATGWNQTIRLWDPANATIIGEIETPARTVSGLRFSPDGNQLVAWFVHDRKIVIWNPKTQKLRKSIDLNGSRIIDLDYSPDGKRFATCNWDGDVHIWDAQDLDALGTEPKLLDHVDGSAKTVAWLYDGQALAVGTPGRNETIHWLHDSKAIETLGQNRRILDFDFSNEHSLVLSNDYESGVVVRDLEQPDIRSDVKDILQGHTDRVWSIAVSPDGESIVSASRDGSILRWPPPNEQWNWLSKRPHYDDLVDDFVWSPDGKQLILSRTHHCSINAWPSGTPIAEAEWLTGTGSDPMGFAFEAVANDPKGEWIATGHRDGTIRIWDPLLQSPIKTLSGMGTGEGVWALRCSPDGKLLCACSRSENRIKLWWTDTWEEHWSAPADDCDDMAFSPDSSRLVFCDSRQAVLVETATGKEVHRLGNHSITVHGVAISGDGRFVATACEDRKLRLWNLQSGKLLSTLSGHVASIQRVAFSGDSETIATGDDDGSIRLWHVETRQQIYELANLGSEIDKLAFDPSGNILVAATNDGRVHVFDGSPDNTNSVAIDSAASP